MGYTCICWRGGYFLKSRIACIWLQVMGGSRWAGLHMFKSKLARQIQTVVWPGPPEQRSKPVTSEGGITRAWCAVGAQMLDK